MPSQSPDPEAKTGQGQDLGPSFAVQEEASSRVDLTTRLLLRTSRGDVEGVSASDEELDWHADGRKTCVREEESTSVWSSCQASDPRPLDLCGRAQRTRMSRAQKAKSRIV